MAMAVSRNSAARSERDVTAWLRGFGLGTGTSAEGWLDNAVRFWEKHILP